MADNLFFSRDTRVIVSDRHASAPTYWEIPVLDGFSFSQATNTSEITLNEMEAAAGGSRRGRRMFNDSYAPGAVLYGKIQVVMHICTVSKRHYGLP